MNYIENLTDEELTFICKIITEKEIKRNVYYDDLGHVYCYSPWTAEKREMAYDGYDKTREAHSYKCPVKAYGIECKGCEECPVNTKVRIKRKENPKVFTEVARNTYKWKKDADNVYQKRIAQVRFFFLSYSVTPSKQRCLYGCTYFKIPDTSSALLP